MNVMTTLDEINNWNRYVECNPLPNVRDETELHTFLSLWDEEEVKIGSDLCLQSLVEKCRMAELVISLLLSISGEAFEDGDHEKYAWTYEYTRALRAVTKKKIDVATQQVLHHLAQSVITDHNGMKSTDYATDELAVGIWAHTHTTRDRRAKQITFPALGIDIDLPSALQNVRSSFRVIRTSFNALFEEDPPEVPLDQFEMDILLQCCSSLCADYKSKNIRSSITNITNIGQVDPLLSSTLTVPPLYTNTQNGALGNTNTHANTLNGGGKKKDTKGVEFGFTSPMKSPRSGSSEDLTSIPYKDTFSTTSTFGTDTTMPVISHLRQNTLSTVGQYAPRDNLCWSSSFSSESFAPDTPLPGHLLSPSHWVTVGGVIMIEQIALPSNAKKWSTRSTTVLRDGVVLDGELQYIPYPAEDNSDDKDTSRHKKDGTLADGSTLEGGSNGNHGNTNHFNTQSSNGVFLHSNSSAMYLYDSNSSASLLPSATNGSPEQHANHPDNGSPEANMDGTQEKDANMMMGSTTTQDTTNGVPNTLSDTANSTMNAMGSTNTNTGTTNLGGGGNETHASTQGPLTITYKLPDNIILEGSKPTVACWDPVYNAWDPTIPLVLHYDADTRMVTVQLSVLKPLAVLVSRYGDTPLLNWTITPAGPNTVLATFQGSRYAITIQISGVKAVLISPEIPELQNILHVPMPVGLLLFILRQCGIRLIHTNSLIHELSNVRMQTKSSLVTELLVSEIASIASVCTIQSHLYNSRYPSTTALLLYKYLPVESHITTPEHQGDMLTTSATQNPDAAREYINSVLQRTLGSSIYITDSTFTDTSSFSTTGTNHTNTNTTTSTTTAHACICEEVPCICGSTKGNTSSNGASDPLSEILQTGRITPDSSSSDLHGTAANANTNVGSSRPGTEDTSDGHNIMEEVDFTVVDKACIKADLTRAVEIMNLGIETNEEDELAWIDTLDITNLQTLTEKPMNFTNTITNVYTIDESNVYDVVPLLDQQSSQFNDWGVLQIKEDGIRVCLREDECAMKGVRGNVHVCASRAIGEAIAARAPHVRNLIATSKQLEERLQYLKTVVHADILVCETCQSKQSGTGANGTNNHNRNGEIEKFLNAKQEDLRDLETKTHDEDPEDMYSTSTIDAGMMNYEDYVESECISCVEQAFLNCYADTEVQAEEISVQVLDAIDNAEQNTLLTQLTLRKMLKAISPFCSSV